MTKPHFNIYTDGASRKDGRGGWGYVVFQGAVQLYHDYGGVRDTTNNQMELLAAIKGLRSRPAGDIITLYSDSQYVVKGITEYMDLWLRTGWRTGANKPVKNQDLWETLAELDVDRKVTWQWVRGHIGDVGNELADKLAGRGVPPARQD